MRITAAVIVNVTLGTNLLGQVRWNHFYHQGLYWLTVSSAGQLAAALTVQDDRQYLIVRMGVVNRSSHNIDIVPEGITLLLAEGNGRTKVLDRIPPERIVQKINSSVAWSALLSAIAAGIATREETAVSHTRGDVAVVGAGGSASGTFSGTTVTSRQVPDYQRQHDIMEEQRRREASAAQRGQAISATALRSTTLTPGQTTGGAIYFKRDRSCSSRHGCLLRLNVPLGDLTLPIHWTFNRPFVPTDSPEPNLDKLGPKLTAPGEERLSPAARADSLPKLDHLFIREDGNLIPLELQFAGANVTDGRLTSFVSGEASPVRIRSRRPVVVGEGKKLATAVSRFKLYRMDATAGKRSITFAAGEKADAKSIHLDTAAVGGDRYQFTVEEDLEPGEYAISPAGGSIVFLFAVVP